MSAPSADVLVLFGVTGDLSKKLVLPALYRLCQRQELDVKVVGVAKGDWDHAALVDHARQAVEAHFGSLDEATMTELGGCLSLINGDYQDPATFQQLSRAIHDAGYAAHYLAVPPALFATVAKGLAEAGLNEHSRLIVEKPFGTNLRSAQELTAQLQQYFPDERIMRVDHFLGKESVEDLLVFRFANLLFEPAWNHNSVASVQLTFAEQLDVADRGSFYDTVGAIRDVVQNHLFQVLAYLAMEPPVSDSAQAEQEEKVKLLSAVRAVKDDDVVLGQYRGYRNVAGVAPGSVTETFAAMRLWIDNWRWSDVPFLIRTGKCMPTTELEAVLELRQPPRLYPLSSDADRPEPNLIRLALEPEAGITLNVYAKVPGATNAVREVPLSVDFSRVLGPVQAAYERILADAISGETRHFANEDLVEQSWRILDGVLDSGREPDLYEPGTWGPDRAVDLAGRSGWYEPVQSG